MSADSTDVPGTSTPQSPASKALTADDLRMAELELRREELRLRRLEVETGVRRSLITILSPTIGAVIALLGALLINSRQRFQTLEVEQRRAEAQFIQEAVKTGDQYVALRNLRFLVQIGALQDRDGRIQALEQHPENTPVLPLDAATALRADLKVNGVDNPPPISPPDSFTYSWSAPNATACMQRSPVEGGAATRGSSIPIGPSHPFYPKPDSPTVLVIACTNGWSTSSDTVIVRLGRPRAAR